MFSDSLLSEKSNCFENIFRYECIKTIESYLFGSYYFNKIIRFFPPFFSIKCNVIQSGIDTHSKVNPGKWEFFLLNKFYLTVKKKQKTWLISLLDGSLGKMFKDSFHITIEKYMKLRYLRKSSTGRISKKSQHLHLNSNIKFTILITANVL